MSLKDEAKKLGILLTDEMTEKFETYTKTLLEYNSFMNLTAIKDEYEINIKHYLDSLSLLTLGKIKDKTSVIDIGAGAGFPSLPCAIACPEAQFTMLDSLRKRVDFLNEAVRRLDIRNARAIHTRAEDAGREASMRESFDIAAARAVADLAVLSEYALPFVKVGGYFLAMKGSAPEAEIKNAKRAIGILGGRIVDVVKVHIEPLDINHTVAIIKKEKKTDPAFPRKAGTPVKKPL